MKTMKIFLISMAVIGTVIVAAINVVLNSNAPIMSNWTLQNTEAYTNDSGESGSGGSSCVCTNTICGTSTTCQSTIFRDGKWVTETTGSVCCCGYTAGYSCSRVQNSYVECDGVKHYC
jgi:hypothetical protein